MSIQSLARRICPLPRQPRIRPTLLAGLMAALLGGCGSLVELPNSGEAPAIYNLTALAAPGPQGTALMLRIEDPTARGGLDLNMIARRSAPTELQYFAEARWNSRVTSIVQAVLAESFENAGQHVTRARGGAIVPAKFELQIDVRDFQAEYYDGATTPTIHLRFAVTLVRLGPLEIVDTTVVTARLPAAGAGMRDVISAFNAAMHDATSEIMGWTVARLEKTG